MGYNRIKRWIGERAGWVAGSLFVISLILYTFAYLIEKGFASLSLGTILAAIATAILLASVSVTIEQYIKTNLSEHELDMIQVCRDFGIQAIQERIVERGEFAGQKKVWGQTGSAPIFLNPPGKHFFRLF